MTIHKMTNVFITGSMKWWQWMECFLHNSHQLYICED
jgi:hypothetical protein